MKKNIIISSIIIVLGLTIFLYFNVFTKKDSISIDNTEKKKMVMERSLSMMLETEAGSGKYEAVTQSDWPADGYIFNSVLSKCENGGELAWDDEKKLVTMTGGLSDKCYAYFDKNTSLTLANYIISQYNGIQGNNNIYYHDGSLTNGISDNSYRYAGASKSVNNYVCISDETTCSDANLFRIIGVFGDQVKLIKATSIGDKTWSDFETHTWSSASLNTYLNNDYLSALGNFAKNYIATTTWKVGGNTYAKIGDVVAATTYTNEITSPAETTEVKDKKIGLMYASDYGFAAIPAAWTTTLHNYNGSVNGSTICSQDWLCLGSGEWLITHVSDAIVSAYNVDSSGFVSRGYVTYTYAVRPAFHLLSTVTYKSGTGESIDPIRLG